MSSDEPLWTARALARAAGGRWLHKPGHGWRPSSIAYNLLTPKANGQVIVCMHPSSWSRDRPDTSLRLPTWIKGGAAGAVVQNNQLAKLPRLPKTFPVLLVDDTRKALSRLAAAGRDRFGGRVIAVTGTVGKTTSREMLRSVLHAQGGATASVGNNNNVPGTERTLASTPADHAWCICEMGFGQPRDGIAQSSLRARPHVALITHIAPAHLDVFSARELEDASDLELVANAKAGIFAGLEPGGAAVLGRDHDQFERVARLATERGAKVTSFGRDPEADVRVVAIETSAEGSTVACDAGGRRIRFRLRIPGAHMAVNATGVLAVVHAAGGDVDAAAAALESFEPVSGRARVTQVASPRGPITLIDDSFNATPDSVKSTLELLALHEPAAGGRRIAVLGDILHLGPRSPRIHAELAQDVERTAIDRVLTIGSSMKRLYDALPERVRGVHAADLGGLYAALVDELCAGDVVTVKASTPVGLGYVVEGLRRGMPTIQPLIEAAARSQNAGPS